VDGLALERLDAVPMRLRIDRARRRQPLGAEAALISLPAVRVIAQQQQRQRQIELRAGIARVERDGALEAFDRLAMPAELDVQMSERVVRLGVMGEARQQPLEAGGRLRMLPELGEELAAMEQRKLVVGVEDQGAVVGGERLVKTIEPFEDQPAITDHLRGDRLLHRRLDQAQGFDIVAPLGAEDRHPVKRVRVRRIGRQDRSVEALRFLGAVFGLELNALQHLRAKIVVASLAERFGHR
jgi:hypothetical protein